MCGGLKKVEDDARGGRVMEQSTIQRSRPEGMWSTKQARIIIRRETYAPHSHGGRVRGTNHSRECACLSS